MTCTISSPMIPLSFHLWTHMAPQPAGSTSTPEVHRISTSKSHPTTPGSKPLHPPATCQQHRHPRLPLRRLANAPNGSNIEFINVTTSSGDYGNDGMPSVNLPINKTPVPSSFHGFVESDAAVSMEAEHASRNTSTSEASYTVIPGCGRTLSGVTLLPVLAPTNHPRTPHASNTTSTSSRPTSPPT